MFQSYPIEEFSRPERPISLSGRHGALRALALLACTLAAIGCVCALLTFEALADLRAQLDTVQAAVTLAGGAR